MPLTDQEKAELRLLGMANPQGKFGLEWGEPGDEAISGAFERGIDNEWFTLVDLCPMSVVVGTRDKPYASARPMRIFRLTRAGRKHRLWLEFKATSAQEEKKT